jgi:hypothetical protein
MSQKTWRFQKERNPAGCSSHDDCARLEGCASTQMPNYLWDVKDQIVGLCLLSLLAIDFGS